MTNDSRTKNPRRTETKQDRPNDSSRKRDDRGTERRTEIVSTHGDGVVLWKQLALPGGDWVVCITEREDPLLGRFWKHGEALLGDRSLRFFALQRRALHQICAVHSSVKIAAGLSAPPPTGYVLLAVFVAGGTALAVHPELDVTVVNEGVGL